MNSKAIFQLALNLDKPWYVSDIVLKDESGKKELHVTIDFENGHFIDTDMKSIVHDRKDRTWRHLNFFEHECYLHCKVPRVLSADNKVKQVEVPWSRTGSGFTLLFEAFSMCLIEQEMPVNKVGKVLKEYPNRIWTVFNYWIKLAYCEADHTGITVLGIDETSSKKGHDYLTVAIDMETSRVVHVTEGKGADTIEKIAAYLDEKGSPPDQIEQVCIDLSPSFISGVNKAFKSASIVFDRFHVKALLNKAMDELRKSELRRHHTIKGFKYLFLKSEQNLSSKQKEQRNIFIEMLPTIGHAYRLKILFDDFWNMRSQEKAMSFLAYWCDLAEDAKIEPFLKFAKTVKEHWQGIVNYTKYKITNGILEGTNSKIQLAKRRARGYRNKKNFINMIYFLTAKLKFNYPLYLA